jgi:hypothetical protein
MTRRLFILISILTACNAVAQSDFNTHIGAHLSNRGISSVGYPINAESGLYGHFLPEIFNEDISLELEVSPNPFRKSFSVSCDDQEIFSIELREVLGRVVYASESKNLYQPNVPAGKYYLVATTSSGQAIKTIIRIE